MAVETLYQYQMDLNGNPQYVNPEYYLYALSDGTVDTNGIYTSYISQRKMEDAIIKDKYAKYSEKSVQPVGTGMKWQKPMAAPLSNAASMPSKFSFGALSKVN